MACSLEPRFTAGALSFFSINPTWTVLEFPPTAPPATKSRRWPKSFASILSGFKKHEIRVNDRDFREGDELCLREWNPVTPTGCAGLD